MLTPPLRSDMSHGTCSNPFLLRNLKSLVSRSPRGISWRVTVLCFVTIMLKPIYHAHMWKHSYQIALFIRHTDNKATINVRRSTNVVLEWNGRSSSQIYAIYQRQHYSEHVTANYSFTTQIPPPSNVKRSTSTILTLRGSRVRQSLLSVSHLLLHLTDALSLLAWITSSASPSYLDYWLGYGSEGRSSIPSTGNRLLLHPYCQDLTETHLASYSMGTGNPFSGIKRPGREADPHLIYCGGFERVELYLHPFACYH